MLIRPRPGRALARLILGLVAFFMASGATVWAIHARFIMLGKNDLGYVVILVLSWLFGVTFLLARYLRARQLWRLLVGHVTAPRRVQPPSAIPLSPGERIQIERQGPREPLWVKQGAGIFAFAMWAITLFNAKSFIQSAFGVFFVAVVALPLILNARKGVALLRISADDDGITVTSGRQQPQFMAWAEMTRIIREFSLEEATRSMYLVVGFDRVLDFSPFEGQDAQKYTFAESYDAYRSGVARILATMVVRTGRPIMTAAYAGSLRESVFELTMEDAQMLPLAPAEMQPQSADCPKITTDDDRLVIGPRLERGWFAAKALLPAFIALALFQGFLLIHYTDWFAHVIHVTNTTALLWAVSFVLAPVLPWAVFFQIEAAAFRRNYPYIIASDHGIARMSAPRWPTSDVTIISWSKIQAWVVLPPRKGRTEYVLFSEENTLHWGEQVGLKLDEPTLRGGDQRLAYQRRATQLHALIAQRTGLALRIIQREEQAS